MGKIIIYGSTVPSAVELRKEPIKDKKLTKFLKFLTILILASISCNIASTPTPAFVPVTEEFVQPETPTLEAFTFTPVPSTETFTPIPPTETSTATAIPTVESLKATVTADLLSCRYGPGSEYLYLFAFRKTTKIKLLGQTGGNSWVLVENSPQKCWVHTKYLDIAGDPKTLPVLYPEGYKLPVTQYYSLYGSPVVLSAVRDSANPNQVTVDWAEIQLRRGDEEDENMFIYIIEVWRCEGGQIIFDPLASNYPQITFVDEPGCSVPSHGRVFFQEKHGYTGPTEIPWPAH
jgi:uncharacterized protein YraI